MSIIFDFKAINRRMPSNAAEFSTWLLAAKEEMPENMWKYIDRDRDDFRQYYLDGLSSHEALCGHFHPKAA
jgi:hypothetical protein